VDGEGAATWIGEEGSKTESPKHGRRSTTTIRDSTKKLQW
jgi:hypothetical protein